MAKKVIKQETKDLSYSQALAEIEQIINLLSSGEVDLDTLPEKVKRGAELISLCKSKLQETEDSVNKILE